MGRAMHEAEARSALSPVADKREGNSMRILINETTWQWLDAQYARSSVRVLLDCDYREWFQTVGSVVASECTLLGEDIVCIES